MQKIYDVSLLLLTVIIYPLVMLYLIGFMIAGCFVTGKKKCKVCGSPKNPTSICGAGCQNR